MKLFGSKDQSKHADQSRSIDERKHSLEDTQKLPNVEQSAVNNNQLNNSKSKRRGRGLIIAIIVFLAVLLCLFLGYKLWRKPPEIQQGGIHTADITPAPKAPDNNTSVMAPDDAVVDEPALDTEAPQTADYDRQKGTYTFLLVGSDNGFGNTDTIIYALFDTVNHTLNVVNIPRDTQVNVPWSIKRINAVYANSGNDISRLRQEVGHMVGYELDESYAVIDLEAFVKIVDCIGGVDYDVPMDMFYSIPDQNFNIALLKGWQHLDGDHALQLVRYRAGYADADIGRINTQQDFLMTVAKEMLRLKNIPNLPELINIVSEYVDTNLSAANIAFFAEEFLKMDSDNIHFYTVPGTGHTVKGGAYYFITTSQWVNIVNEGFNPFNVELSAANMNYLVYQNGDVYTSTGMYYGTDTFLDYEAYINSLLHPEGETATEEEEIISEDDENDDTGTDS